MRQSLEGGGVALVETGRWFMSQRPLSKGNRRNPLVLLWWNSCSSRLPIISRAAPITFWDRLVENRSRLVSTLATFLRNGALESVRCETLKKCKGHLKNKGIILNIVKVHYRISPPMQIDYTTARQSTLVRRSFKYRNYQQIHVNWLSKNNQPELTAHLNYQPKKGTARTDAKCMIYVLPGIAELS